MDAVIGTVKEVQEGIEWTIADFLLLPERDTYDSPRFFFAAASWILRIRVFSTGDMNGRDIYFFLKRTTHAPPNHLEWSFSVKTQDGNKYQETQRTEVIHNTIAFYSGYISLDSQRMSELVPNGTLTVLCTFNQRNVDAAVSIGQIRKISESEERQTVSKRLRSGSKQDFSSLANGENSRSEFNVPLYKNRLSQDYKQLFLSQEDCDVIIRVQEREFKAHRNILKARSPVFASTLRSNVKGKATGIVDIQDLDPSAFSDFLCFLYCAELDNLSEENVFGLFTAADKYDVQDLREKCVEYMKQNLSVDTFCDAIQLAFLHSETELIQLSTDFFIKNALEITKTVKWQMFNVDNPIQGNELFIKFISSVKRSDE